MDCIYKKNIKRIATIGFKKVFVLHSLPQQIVVRMHTYFDKYIS